MKNYDQLSTFEPVLYNWVAELLRCSFSLSNQNLNILSVNNYAYIYFLQLRTTWINISWVNAIKIVTSHHVGHIGYQNMTQTSKIHIEHRDGQTCHFMYTVFYLISAHALISAHPTFSSENNFSICLLDSKIANIWPIFDFQKRKWSWKWGLFILNKHIII